MPIPESKLREILQEYEIRLQREKDARDSRVNEVYAKHFTGAVLPARAAFAVRDLPKGAKVEIELVAYKG